MRLVGFEDGELDEEEREHREYQGLDDADEHLEADQRRREEIGEEESRDEDHDFAREDVSEETEGEGDETTDIAHELDQADGEIDGRGEVDVFPGILKEAEDDDARYLDDEKGDDGEREGEIEIGGRSPQEGDEPALVSALDAHGADARQEG